MPKTSRVTFLLGLALLVIAFLPDYLFILALRFAFVIFAIYVIYLSKKVYEMERGVRIAEEIGLRIKELSRTKDKGSYQE